MPSANGATTTFQMNLQVDDPTSQTGFLPTRPIGGTVSKTSRMVAAMNGSTMIANTKPAR